MVAGIGAGLVGYLTGMASLISYPAMLAAGLSPVAANITQTIGLVGVGAGAAARTVPVLLENGRRDITVQLAIAGVGGLVGGGLLLTAGERTFTALVPWLIAVASLGVVLGPRLRQLQGERRAPRAAYLFGLALVSVYGGYFGAGSGTIYLALAILTTSQTFARSMLVKSVLLGASNLTASVLFIVSGLVHWGAALALGLGCLLGGHLGPKTARLIPEARLRAVVALCGLGLTWWLAVR